MTVSWLYCQVTDLHVSSFQQFTLQKPQLSRKVSKVLEHLVEVQNNSLILKFTKEVAASLREGQNCAPLVYFSVLSLYPVIVGVAWNTPPGLGNTPHASRRLTFLSSTMNSHFLSLDSNTQLRQIKSLAQPFEKPGWLTEFWRNSCRLLVPWRC